MRVVSEKETADIFRCFSYDSVTGVVSKIHRFGNRAKLGEVTELRTNGYLVCRLGKRSYQAHRVAWLLHYGSWPDGEIDHINLVKTDNRICNLRLANRLQNICNTPVRKDSRTGIKGVSLARSGRFSARINISGKYKQLGTFDTAEAAHGAYCAELKKKSAEFARDR